MEILVLLLVLAILTVAMTAIAIKYPVWLIGLCALAVLIVSCTPAEAADGVPVGTWAPWVFLVALVPLVVLVFVQRHHRGRLEDEIIELTKRAGQAEANVAPEFCLRDITSVYHRQHQDDAERLVLIKFSTTAGMQDFYQWLTVQSRRAKGGRK